MNPRPDRREQAIEHLAAGMKLILRGVIIVGCPHGTDEREIVDHFAHVRPPVRHLNAEVAVLAITDLERENFELYFPDTGRGLPYSLRNQRRRQYILVRSVANRLTRI